MKARKRQDSSDHNRGGGRSPSNRRKRRSRSSGGRRNSSSRTRTRDRSQGAKRNAARGGRPGTEFWGDKAALPEPQTDVRMTDAPAAVPRSLGAPPLPGHETIAEHFFDVVYGRAVTTAGALAAAGGLIDADALTEDA